MSIIVSIVFGFSTGVFLKSVFDFGWPAIIFVLIVFSLFTGANFFKPRRAYVLGAVFCLFVIFGIIRTTFTDTPAPDPFIRDIKHRVSYQAVVVSDPDVREKNQRIALEVKKDSTSTGILAVMPLSSDVKVGDQVQVYGTLSLPQAFETENGRTFRYDKYLQARGIRFLIQFGSIHTIKPAPWYSVQAILARIKHAFLDGLNRSIPKPDSALAGGIVIGGKSGLGTSLTEAFTQSGLVQIIVLSGYNIMVVAEWVMVLLARIRLPRRLQFIAGGAALLLFVGIAGISATALRATIMAVIALYARATGRSYYASRALLFAIFIMLLWNPLYLVFDPGFDLSIAATAGVIWLSPIIEVYINRMRPFFRNAVATTLAAQISVLPLLLYNMGLLSFVAFPANIAVNPLVPFAMALAAIAGVVGMTVGLFIPVIAKIAGFPVLVLTRYFIFIAEKSSSLPFATMMIERFPFWAVLVVYFALIYFVATTKIKSPQLS